MDEKFVEIDLWGNGSDGSLVIIPGVYECQTCGAIVIDPEKHVHPPKDVWR